MGNDGGSICKRDDLVKTKSKGEQIDKRNQLLAVWLYCALSKKQLQQPVVACPLGKLYNKDSLLEYLLNPPSATLPLSATPFGADGIATAGHIRSLKDVVQLDLTPNTNAQQSSANGAQAGAEDSVGRAQFVCPLSQREINGATRFVYLKHCGTVVSEAALKDLRASDKKANVVGNAGLSTCSICGQSYAEGEPEFGVLLNPSTKEDIDRMKDAWEETKRREKEIKKANKKRKSLAADDVVEKDAPKKSKKSHVAPLEVVQSSNAPRLPAAIAQALEAKKAQMAGTAIAKLYHVHDPNKKEEWMIRSTMARR